MARRKKHEEHVNHEAWAIPYGDLITLLLAFFVVLYATSSVNEGKYRVLSHSLAVAFNQPRSMQPTLIGDPVAGDGETQTAAMPVDTVHIRMQQGSLIPLPFPLPNDPFGEAARQREQAMQEMESAMSQALSGLIDNGSVRMQRDGDQLRIAIASDLLFGSASADLAPSAIKVLNELAVVLSQTQQAIIVEGHTDDVPIRTRRFPSNWELSAGRAGRVLRLFSEAGISDDRMSMAAYGAERPEVPNTSSANRSRNRRVVVTVGLPSAAGTEVQS